MPRFSASAAKVTVIKRSTSLKAWEIPKEDSAFAPAGVWSNHDCEPVPPAEWTWGTMTFVLYWMSDLVQGSAWTAVASLFSLGLTWWEGLLAIFSGSLVLSVVIALNGVIGARLHTPFAVTCRAAYGYQLSKFCVISRMVIAWFWFSIQTYSGGLGVTEMLTAIWPSYRTMPNHLPASAGVSSKDFLSFFLFWLIQFPFILVHPRKLKPIFLAKGILLPIVAVGTMAWSIHRAGPFAAGAMRAPSTLRGAEGYLAFTTAATSQAGQWVTLACNIGDFSRYSKKPSSALYQISIVPLLFTTTAAFGAISTNCLQAAYGEVYFTPFQVIELWQGTHVGRFFAFVCSLAWILGYIGLNITANSISAANDSAALLPRFITIFRGQMIAVTVGCFAFAPWKVMASASSVVTFAASYSVVLAPIASVMCVDYYIVKRSKYDVPALYDPKGIYYYNFGCNWRALVALICAIAPCVPGMAHSLNSTVEIGGIRYLYAMGIWYALAVGAGVYVALSKVFPDHLSMVAEAVYAHEELERRRQSSTPSLDEEDKKELGEGYVLPVKEV